MDFVPVQSFDNYIDAHIVLGRMEEEGINCWLKDENTVTITPFFANAVGGIKLMVDTEQLTQAKQLLVGFQEEKKSMLACPFCGSHNIELLPAKNPLNWLGAIATWLTSSYALSTENIWQCFNCNKEFKQPVDSSHDSQQSSEQNF